MRLSGLAISTLTIGAIAALVLVRGTISPSIAQPGAPQAGACAFPTAPSATPQETAWRLFVAANCPSNSGKVVWENWIEQSNLYPANGSAGTAALGARIVNRLHGSPLAMAFRVRKALLTHQKLNLLSTTPEVCSDIQKNAQGQPSNVVAGAQVCEEARLNPDARSFVMAGTYQIRSGQTAAAQKGTDIEFTKPAVEVKVDWIPASDFKQPFTCAKPPAGLHVETINGACYALAGMHISSKLLDNWLWATFEPQSMVTNTLRCISFGPCNDPWGSVPAVSNGGAAGFTKQTPAIQALMKAANLAPEFSNYRLDGAQVDFTKPDGTPTYLGNSIIEGENVGMTYNTASCITCHSVSTVKNDGTDGLNVLISMANSPVGPKYTAPANWIARDFVWSLGLACPVPAGTQGLQTCTAAKKTK